MKNYSALKRNELRKAMNHRLAKDEEGHHHWTNIIKNIKEISLSKKEKIKIKNKI